ANGVSALHGKVSRSMWKAIWPNLPESEIPITSITNGVHTRTWMATDFFQLYDRYLGGNWDQRPTDHSIWKKVDNIPNAELWRTQHGPRKRFAAGPPRPLPAQPDRGAPPPREPPRADEAPDPKALTIVFPRRFATYKRGTLIFRNLERLAAILNNKE